MNRFIEYCTKLKFFKGREAIGVHITLDNDESEINAVKLCIDDDEVNIEGSLNTFELSELKSFSEGLPVHLSFYSDKIVNKSFEVEPLTTTSEVVSSVFPSVNEEELFVQRYDLTETKGTLSIVNISLVNELLAHLKSFEINVQVLYLGSVALHTYSKNLIAEKTQIVVAKQQLDLIGGGIAKLQNSSLPPSGQLEIDDGQFLESSLFLPYFNALGFFLPAIPVVQTKVELIDFNQVSLFVFNYWFFVKKKIMPAALGVVFIAALVNAFLFMKNDDLQQVRRSHTSELKVRKALLKDLDKKNEVIKSLGRIEDGELLYYVDQLATSIVPNIKWNDLYVFPLFDEKVEYLGASMNKSIKIKGNCKDAQDLSKWIGKLNQLDWVESLTNPIFEWDDKKKQGNFEFEILVE